MGKGHSPAQPPDACKLRPLTCRLRQGQAPFLPATIFACFAVYLSAFISSFAKERPYDVVDDKIDIVVTKVSSSTKGDATAAGAPAGDAAVGEASVVTAVDVKESFVIKPKPAHPLMTLLTGAPSPSSLVASALTLLVNCALVAMTADLTYTARVYYDSADLSFVRVGYVGHAEAKFLVREPDQSKMPVTIELHIKDAVAPYDNPLWQKAGVVRWTTNETDYTAAVTVPLRHSSQRTYEWRSSNGHSGEFTSAAAPGAPWTLNDGKFTFLTTSCILRRLPYSPLAHPLSIPGFKTLASVLPELHAQFMLFLGDFIYVDVPRRFGRDRETYRREYRQVYASPDWPAVGQNLSWIHVLDDHEIANDWSSGTAGVYGAAVDAWHLYQSSVNPPVAHRADGEGGSFALRRHGATWFEFDQGPASFFMLDTRTHRSSNKLPAQSKEKTMLGRDQLADFLAWLRRPPVHKGIKWKIVASSVPLTKNWPVNDKDTWAGFLAERRTVLEAMWDAHTLGVGVVVLSGDRHEFAATAFPPPKDGRWPQEATVHEFSVSPLNQFYSPLGSYKQTDDDDVKIK